MHFFSLRGRVLQFVWLLKEILYAIARVTVLHIVLVVKTRMSRDNHVSQVGILIMSRLISYEIR